MKLISILAVIVPLATAFAPTHPARLSMTTKLFADASIQFVRGLDEKVVPDIKLMRAHDGSSGTATFCFKIRMFLMPVQLRRVKLLVQYVLGRQ